MAFGVRVYISSPSGTATTLTNERSRADMKIRTRRTPLCLLVGKECLEGTIEEAFRRLSKHHAQEGMRTWTQIRGQYTTAHKIYEPVDEEVWERVSHVEDKLGYKFQDRPLLVTALRPKEGQHNVGDKTNDTLEYLGDSVLELLTPLLWITEGREKEVLELTDLSLTNRALQAACLSCGLEGLLVGHTKIVTTLVQYEAAWTTDPDGAYWETVAEYKPLADVMKALFGAVFLDCGMKFSVVQQLFRRLHWPAVNCYTWLCRYDG
ncbi:MAG: ribonuclease III domain-containing protein [Benniella sp.]|nr:MAG: ribonuclease III domain-containing protein [Benniella sp.]